MGMIWMLATLLSFYLFESTQGQPSQYFNTSLSWTNSYSRYSHLFSSTGDMVKIVLLRNVSGSTSQKFACGFFCYSDSCFNSSVFVILAMVVDEAEYVQSTEPKVVWSANGKKTLGSNAKLELTADGDLIIQDGSLVWSTNTKGKSVAGINLTESGNLVLFDKNNATVWQSFDHPTDTLLLGQKFHSGQKLISTNSSTNLPQTGSFSVSLTNDGFYAFMESDPSLVYFKKYFWSSKPTYAMLSNGTFAVYDADQLIGPPLLMSFPQANSMQHVRLDFDGQLRVYDLVGSSWKVVAEVLTSLVGFCDSPLACGKYGICSTKSEDGSGLCSCPQASNNANISYFKPTSEREPSLGCTEINPLSCKDSKSQKLVELKNVEHLRPLMPDINDTDVESCKLACLNNCSCKAMIFGSSFNSCYSASQIFSLKDTKEANEFRFFLKVQDDSSSLTPQSIVPSPVALAKRKRRQNLKILGWSFGAFSGFLLIIAIYVFLSRKKQDADDSEEDYLDEVSGMPKRYTYEDLIAITDNFVKKLGQGGFGSVFEGTLKEGTVVAVKCLNALGQSKESFLSEVQTIGRSHHINLVRLIGYCNNKSHKLLVYEYMCNGSLDKWIFHGSQGSTLDWQTRRMIILDIAKGLAYLHDGCRQKIFHLDIKPQNILLDENFRAKVSDFGLSKLIDRDQSQVVTIMKGTPGYMAPEWLNSVITEKVDVYSFGVVVLEILCGRKNVDRSQPEEDMHLLSVFKRKKEQDQLLDIIDKNNEDMVSNGAEVMKMMKVAAWCLQSDYAKRPCISVVVNVLEGLLDVEENLEFDFSFSSVSRGTLTPGPKKGGSNVATQILPSILSGPR